MGRSSAKPFPQQRFGQSPGPNVTTQAQAVPTLANPGTPALSGYSQQPADMTPADNGVNYGGGAMDNENLYNLRQQMQLRDSPFFGRLY